MPPMLTEALNEAVGLDCADIEGEAAGFLHHVGSKVRSVGYVEGQSPTIIAEKPPATVYRRDAEPLAFNAGNKNDMAHIDGRGEGCARRCERRGAARTAPRP